MCLIKIVEEPKKDKRVRVGYTIFKHGYDKEWRFAYFNLVRTVNRVDGPITRSSCLVPMNEWLRADGMPVSVPGANRTYTSGFHIYSTLEGAKAHMKYYRTEVEAVGSDEPWYYYEVVKVKYRGIICKGLDGMVVQKLDRAYDTVVAEEMFVPEKERQG